jgi:hypothetical protein
VTSGERARRRKDLVLDSGEGGGLGRWSAAVRLRREPLLIAASRGEQRGDDDRDESDETPHNAAQYQSGVSRPVGIQKALI